MLTLDWRNYLLVNPFWLFSGLPSAWTSGMLLAEIKQGWDRCDQKPVFLYYRLSQEEGRFTEVCEERE
jgi:hypothetical protein